MKRKFILLMMMCLLGLFGSSLRAQEDVVTINGDATSYMGTSPIPTYNSYSLAQIVFTSTEIGHSAGTIDKIAFKLNFTETKNFTFYLQNTSVETMTGWVAYSDEDKVYTNTSFDPTDVDSDGWLTIDIDDFEYSGGNLLFTSSNNTGITGDYFKGFAYNGNVGRNATCYKGDSGPVTISSAYNTSTRQPAIKLFFAADNCTEAPNTPSNLVATANDHASITLTWDAVDGAKGYNIYNGDNNIASTKETTYTVNGLSAETQYSYTVTAVCGTYESDHSVEATATTEAYNGPQLYRVKIVGGGSGVYGIGQYLNIKSYTMSTAPTSNVGVASKSNNDAQLFSLEDAGNGNYYLRSAQGYYIECGAYNTWNVDAYQTTPNTPLTFEYVGTTNNFYIRNYKVSGDNYFKSQDSGVYCDAPKDQYQVAIWTLEVDINDNIIPAAPESLVATAVDHKSISLTWEAGDAYAISYNIYQDGVKIGTSMGTSYTVDNLPNAETQYCFTVKAVRGENESEASNEACATTAEAPKTRKIVFTLTDSYGDGWQKNYLTVVADDGTNEILRHSSGSTATYTLDIVQGAKVTVSFYAVNYYNQTYSEECSYTIKYADGDVIYESGSMPSYSAGTVIPFEFTVESINPSVTIDLDPATIDLGDVRMGEYWSERDQKSAQFDVVVKYTTITNASCDNAFFVVEYDANESVVNVSYNPESEVTGAQSGIITITAEDCDPVTVAVTANAYTAIAPDAIEAYTTIEFTDGPYTNTPTFANLHDDYILPDEVNEGETPDAVYQFTLENESLVTVNVEGTNGITAIYKAEDINLENNIGPSSDNNYEGVVPEALPEEMDIVIGDNNTIANGYLPSNEYYKYTISQQIYTANEINATKGTIASVSFRQRDYISQTRNLAVYMLNTAQSAFDGTSSWVALNSNNLVFSGNVVYPAVDGGWVEIALQTPFEYTGENLLLCVVDNTGSYTSDNVFDTYETSEQRAIYTQRDDSPYDVTNVGVAGTNTINDKKVVNTVKFHGEFVVETENEEPQNGVVYPAGTYYLVAAAEGEFTVSLSVETVPAPGKFAYASPENNAMEQENPKLTWEASEYATSYKVYLGTELPLTEYVTVETQSYQTENLQNNTKYYWSVTAVNSSGEKAGEVYSFVTPLNQATELAATVTNLYPGDETTISWTGATGATGYNVYVNDVKVNAEPITETSYTLSNLEYNMNPGNAIAVTAVHALGESPKCEAVYVKVAGEFTLVINVKDAEGNALEGAAVAFNTESYYDEYYQLIPAVETLYTDANGKITQVLPLPCVYDYYNNPTYAQMTVTVSNEYAYDEPVYIDSYTELAAGEEYVQDVTLQYVAPENIQLDDYYNQYVVGEEMTMTWETVDGAIGYNVYERGEWNEETIQYDYTLLTAEVLTDATFTVELTEYAPDYGLVYAVTAVYSFGESLKKDKYVYVTGKSQISAVVKNAGDEALKGAIVTLTGEDEFGNNKTYEFTTDAEGAITENVLVGTYTAIISHYDYEDYISEEFEIVYGTPYNLGTITLTARTGATIAVTAAEAADGSKVEMSWEAEYEKYNVYRRNVETKEFVKLASDVTLKEYEATDWATLENGTYQYGVSAFIEQNLDYSEGFENGIPETWAVYNARGAASTYDWTTAETHAGKASYDGTYAAYAKSSRYGEDIDYYYMVTDLIDLSNLTNAELSFAYHTPDYYYYSNPQSNYTNTLKVKILTEGDGQNSATPSVSYLWTSNKTHTGNWVIKTLDLSSYAGQKIYVAFENYPYYGTCSSVDAVKVSSHESVESAVVWSEPIEKVVVEFTNAAEDNDWHNAANWSTGAVPTAENNVTIAAAAVISSQNAVAKNITIASGASVTVNAERTLTAENIYNTVNSHSQLIINDGAQVIQNNEGVLATFNMGILNPETWGISADGWQFIAVPFTNAAFVDFTGFMTTNYDLFKYDGEAEDEWQNHKDVVGFGDTEFVNGRAYLASHENKEIATIYGTLNNASSHTWELTHKAEKDLANFHLIGNPFSFDMDWSTMTLNNIYDGFAYVNEEGGYSYGKDNEDNIIKVGDGFFVLATDDEPSLSYGAAKRGNAKSESINLIATSNAGNDNLIISLDGAEDKGFNKLENFNKEIAEIYVANNGGRYAIMSYDENVTEIPVSFDAKQMGNYTINAIANGKFSSVILVDRFTGIETNLLLEGYSFTSSSDENHDRFIVKLVNGQQTTDNSHFAYVSGEDLILNIEGKVQIIDVMGRIVYANDVTSANNRINVSAFDNAAYLIRVVNEEGVKTQKLVVNSL